jgi:hypothetical protein
MTAPPPAPASVTCVRSAHLFVPRCHVVAQGAAHVRHRLCRLRAPTLLPSWSCSPSPAQGQHPLAEGVGTSVIFGTKSSDDQLTVTSAPGTNSTVVVLSTEVSALPEPDSCAGVPLIAACNAQPSCHCFRSATTAFFETRVTVVPHRVHRLDDHPQLDTLFSPKS